MDVSRSQETPLQAIQKLLFASFLMCSMPFVAYFASKKFVFEDYFHYSTDSSNLLAVIPAVFVVNIVIAIYIYLAWSSEPWKDKFEQRTKEE